MTRKIELTKIHAINWYGYCDSFDIRGDLLVAGVTGSGKSVLMDLIQFVLVGDKGKIRYNQSATGEKSTRDLIGYCLGDIKQDIAGARQFMRNKGGITFVALEFVWPGRKQIETWGFRIEFEGTVRREPSKYSPFLIMGSLNRNDFLDDSRKPLELNAFKELVERFGGRIFTGPQEYRREMSLASHLNFDRFTLDHLLPTAMSFTFMDSFNDFCREYILPAEDVDIQSVKDSYLAFLNLQRELGLLRDQLERLEKIQLLDQRRIAAQQEASLALYLEAHTRWQDSHRELAQAQSELTSLTTEMADETLKLGQLDKDISNFRRQLEDINSSFNATPDGQLYLRITNDNRRIANRIAQLKAVADSVQKAKEMRARNVQSWLSLLGASPFPINQRPIAVLKFAAEQLATAELETLKEHVATLSSAVTSALDALQAAARPTLEKQFQLQQEVDKHSRMLQAARAGLPTDNTVLLIELNRTLSSGSRPVAQALWQLCEIVDERWRPAIETAFTRKFAVVVEPKDYDQAERIYHELRHESRGESLVNPQQIPHAVRKSGSLAEKIETNHPVARAIVDHLFGDVICVEQLTDLRKHPKAILPDGFMAQRPFVQRSRHYDNRPCIGKRGLEKQQIWVQEQISDLQARKKNLDPLLQEYEALRKFAADHKLESSDLHDELERSKQLPELEKELNDNLDTLKRISTTDFRQKRQDLTFAANQLEELERQRTELLRKSRQALLEGLQTKAANAEKKHSEFQNSFENLCKTQDFSSHQQQIEELRQSVLATCRPDVPAADAFLTQHHNARSEAREKRATLVGERKMLAAHPDYSSQYADYDPEVDSNEGYDKRLKKIRDAEIREYEQKANREEANWQQLFRTQVLEKLQQKLGEAEDLIALLKVELREPIGSNRYTITSAANRDDEYQLYRRLIEAATYARDGELFFATVDTEIREAIEKLFTQLIKQPDSREALAFLDYRNYNDYDMLVEDIREPNQTPSSLNKHSGMFSGGENQAPFFIAILACYLRAYRRFERRRRDPALALVPIDEAFSKLSGDCIHDCIAALRHLDLQGIFSMSTGNIPYAIDDCDQVIAVHKQVRLNGKKKNIRNVAALLTREAAYERFAGVGRHEKRIQSANRVGETV